MSHIVGNSMRRSILRKHLLSICLLANINNNTLSKYFIGSAPPLEEFMETPVFKSIKKDANKFSSCCNKTENKGMIFSSKILY
jgi:hypothetical protein